jgi:hypothetical protein
VTDSHLLEAHEELAEAPALGQRMLGFRPDKEPDGEGMVPPGFPPGWSAPLG